MKTKAKTALALLSVLLLASCGRENKTGKNGNASADSGEQIVATDSATVDPDANLPKVTYRLTFHTDKDQIVNNVRIVLLDGEEEKASAKTNRKGYATFTDVPKKDYTIKVDSQGYYAKDPLVFDKEITDQSFILNTRFAPLTEGERVENGMATTTGNLMFSFKGEFVEYDTDGKTVKKTAFDAAELMKGKKALYINIWGTWCGPCCMEMPYLDSFYKSHGGEIAFVAMHTEQYEDVNQIAAFKKQNNYSIPMATHVPSVETACNAGAVPTSVLISPDGIVVNAEVGAMQSLAKVEQFFDGYYTK